MSVVSSETLPSYVRKMEQSGLSLHPFPSTSDGGKYYVIRFTDEDETDADGHLIGLNFACSFSRELKSTIAARPSKASERKKVLEYLNLILRDPKEGGKYSACYCVVDEDSIENGFFTKEQLGQTFTIIAKTKTVLSDDVVDITSEKKAKTVSADD